MAVGVLMKSAGPFWWALVGAMDRVHSHDTLYAKLRQPTSMPIEPQEMGPCCSCYSIITLRTLSETEIPGSISSTIGTARAADGFMGLMRPLPQLHPLRVALATVRLPLGTDTSFVSFESRYG